MSYEKQSWRRSAKNLERYIKSKEFYGSTVDCDQDSVANDFLLVQKAHNKIGKNEAIHIVQSWSEEESKKLTAEQVNKIGLELVKRAYPGHQAFIGTHTDTSKIHNHIMLNPVSIETGERLHNKKHYLEHTRKISNQISAEMGLSVIDPENTTRPKSVYLQIEKDGRFSYNLDIQRKALFASKYARSFQEQATIMKEFGIETKIQNKNTSYRHPEQQRFKRGAKLSPELTNDALNRRFNKNALAHPEGNILELIKSDPEYSKLKSAQIQRDQARKQQLFTDHNIETSKIIKSKDRGVILINERGDRFFIGKNDPIYPDLLEASQKRRLSAINDAKLSKLYNKSGRILFKTQDGKDIWISKKTDPEIFNQYKLEGYYNFANLKHYYLNSSYYKNHPSRTSKQVRQKYVKNDLFNVNSILNDQTYIDNLELLEHEKNSLSEQLTKNHKKTNFLFTTKGKGKQQQLFR